VSAFRVWADVDVRFRDTDAMGHVNNAVYVTYLEVARQVYWRRVEPERAYDRVPFILAHASLDFRAPATVEDALRVLVRTAWIGRSSFGTRYEIRDRAARRLFVTAESVQVTYDYGAQRSIPIPDAIRRAFEAIEGGPLPDKPR